MGKRIIVISLVYHSLWVREQLQKTFSHYPFHKLLKRINECIYVSITLNLFTFINTPVCLYVCMYVSQYVHIYLSIYHCLDLKICLSILVGAHLSIYLSQPVHIYQYISLFVSIYLSIYLSISNYTLSFLPFALQMFVLVVPLLHSHRLWARPCFSSSVLRVWFVELV